MSRFEVFKNKKGLAFGNDHALGEYLQIWNAPNREMPDVDNILVDEDMLTGLNREKMLRLISEHGFNESDLELAFVTQRGG